MTREDYLIYRNKRSPEPLYVFYIENFNKEKHKHQLDRIDFFMYIQTWLHVEEAFEVVINHYDIKFNIVTISDIKTGKIIKFI